MKKDVKAVEAKDAKELARWKKQASFKQYAGYTAVMIIVISLIRVLDDFVTSAPTSLQTDIVNEFFVQGMGLDFAAGLSVMSLIGVPFMFLTILAAFCMSLADRFGRKKVLLFSVFGMAAGTLVCFFATSLVGHLIGRALLVFFVGTDIHTIYVMEVATAGKRATLASVASFFGYLSMVLVSVSRSAFTTDGVLNWRGVFLVPAICGFALFVILLVLGRETKPFLDQRIEHLSIPYSKRVEMAKAKGQKEKSSGIGPAFKYMFKHRQPRSAFIVTVASTLSLMVIMGQYETIMTTSGMTTENVTKALFVYPIVCAIISLGSGYFADKIGRRPINVACAILAFVGLVAFVFSSRSGVNPYVVGAFLGLELGCILSFGNLMGIVLGETVPTEVRSGVAAARGIITMAITIIASIIFSILVGMFDLGILSLIWCGATLFISAFLLIKNVRETKGVNLDEVVSD